MHIKIKNIGKIKTADVELSGITVIGGENNTGKSTVGKALYAVFNAFYKLQEKILREYEKAVRAFLEECAESNRAFFNIRIRLDKKDLQEIVNNLLENKNEYLENDKLLNSFLNEVVKIFPLSKEKVFSSKKKFLDILNFKEEDICKGILQEYLNNEFNSQIINLYNKDNSLINIKIKRDQIKVLLESNDITNLKLNVPITTGVIYIENPFILDNLNYEYNLDMSGRALQLYKKLKTDKDDGVIQKKLLKDKLEKIYEKMNLACSGNLIYEDGKFKYKETNEDSEPLDVRNLSTGLKTFVIIKTLLQKGWLKENGILILDEPEVHLHPEWQLVFAEIIVLIQKEFNMHILINTHSPYFLKAIGVYADKHDVSKCNYYLADEVSKHQTEIKDVTENVELIYKKLAKAFQTLENEEWSDD